MQVILKNQKLSEQIQINKLHSIHTGSLFTCWKLFYAVACLKYAIKFFRSLSFLRPANTILVPGIYFLGLVK